ncbi:factor-independent urate hydroxylase [Streptomyces calidiresistens]|uniref:Uricase n=1 Tax=Streptomyces calidiresistens TaxID=1485586 RepID=A0A7W3T1P1_9ACTN|nr:urate oxidase [Streptomyces calidiresistens]MBB0229216.1 urate oxidase [Streptomyces calidiresistens]
MPGVVLGPARYGKAGNRVVRVVREGRTHHLKDLEVSIALEGDLEETHTLGRNDKVLPTDTVRNTVYAFAREHGIASAEEFALLLARHFVAGQESIHRARVRIEEHLWERIEVPGAPTPDGEVADPPRHSFVRSGRETRIAQVTVDAEGCEVLAGLTGLTVLNTTASEFHGFVEDRYTTLRETTDRILATEVTALWRYADRLPGAGSGTGAGTGPDEGPAPDWDARWTAARDHLLAAFALTHSLSLQQTLYEMGGRVLTGVPGVAEIRLSLPNKHHVPFDLSPFGLENDHEVHVAGDDPHGLIEATVLREGATARIPPDLVNAL